MKCQSVLYNMSKQTNLDEKEEKETDEEDNSSSSLLGTDNKLEKAILTLLVTYLRKIHIIRFSGEHNQ